MKRHGQCVCGAVKFTAVTGDTYGMCYCKMCMQWSSGFMGVTCEQFELSEGAEALKVRRTSDWASRGFCSECGSSIFYEMDGSAKSVALGTFDDISGLEPRIVYFSDGRPEGVSLPDGVPTMTREEVHAKYFSS